LWPSYDTFDLLANAALFAGKGYGYSDLLRPPVLPFLTSIYFMFDGLSIAPILVIDALLYVVGCVGLYFFLKERFTPLLSFLGSLLYATSPLILIYAAVGYYDVPGVSIGIWALYLTYLGVKRNSKFFYLAFPVAMMAVLTKYDMALLMFPMFACILMNWKRIIKHRDIILGMGLGVLVLVPVLVFFYIKLGNPLYPFMSFFTTSGGSGTTIHFAYNQDPLYFVKYSPYYLGNTALLIIFFTSLALLFHLYKNFDIIRAFSWNKIMGDGPKTRLSLALILGIFAVFLITFGKVHYFISEILFFAIIYLVYKITSKWGCDWSMGLLFLSWFATFFIFHSVYVLKDHRYFIFMVAPLAYFLTLAVSFSTERFKFNFKKKNLTLYIFSVILVLSMITFTFAQFESIKTANMGNRLFNEEVTGACNWLMDHDPEYKSKVIYADYWAMFAWHLQMDVGKMPTFRNNTTILLGAKDANFTEEDKKAYDRELNKINPDYYFFTWGEINFTNYKAIKRYGDVTIYQRK
jgi:4-amino-4-deoxy-L-arabinose transferase-like glycosyltransferase